MAKLFNVPAVSNTVSDWHDAGNSINQAANEIYSNASSTINNTVSDFHDAGNSINHGINDYHDAGNFRKPSSLVETGQTEETTNDDEVKWIWPAAPNNGIMGLPAVVGPDDYGTEMGKIFEQSFPIMTIKPYVMTRADINKTYKRGEFEAVPGGCYRFALQNEGGVKLNVSNQFEPSSIESGFKSLAENTMGILGEVNQIVQNNRAMGGPIGQGLTELRDIADESLTSMHEYFNEMLSKGMSKAPGSKVAAIGTDALNTAGNIVDMFARALLLGNRIDIPDIWKGSSGGMTASVKIDLRARNVGSFDGSADDEEYQNQIVTPLKILLALACPLRKTSDKNTGGLSYENPPYLDVTIDKTFVSKCCGISSLSVDLPYNEESYYKSRPMHVIVNIELKDMYSVFVWDNKATNNEAPAVEDDVPSSAMFINRLMDNENGDGLPDSLLILPQNGAPGFGSSSSIFGSLTSSLLGSTLDKISSLTTSITLPITDLAEGLFSNVTANISNNFIDSVLSNTSNLITSTINNTVNNVVSQGINLVNNTVNNAVNSVVNPINQFISQGDTLINQVVGNFSNSMNNLSLNNLNTNYSTSLLNSSVSHFNGFVSEINPETPKCIVGPDGSKYYTTPATLTNNNKDYTNKNAVDLIDEAYGIVYQDPHTPNV